MSKKVDFDTNTLYVNSKNSKYAGHNMYMTDNEDVEVIDPILEEGKKIREHWAQKVKETKQRKLKFTESENGQKISNALQSQIDYYTMRSKMTYGENMEYERRKEEDRQQWFRDNPPKQEIVEKLYKRFDETKDKLNPVPTSFSFFLYHNLNPLDGILTIEEFDSPQYDLILDLLFSDYLDIHKDAIERKRSKRLRELGIVEGEFK